MTLQEIARKLKEGQDKLTSKIIKDLIAQNEELETKAKDLTYRYEGEVKILERKLPDDKANNKLANDYRGDIIDGIVGYMFGVPVSYQVDKNKYDEATYNKITEELNGFIKRNFIADLDSTTGKSVSICGFGYRLCYINQDGKEAVMHLEPWEAVVIQDAVGQTQYAMRYYAVEIETENNKSIECLKVEWYDQTHVYFYLENSEGEYVPDLITESEPSKPHMFKYVPIIKYSNNDEEMGDFEKVETLIDDYDRTTSDISNDIEELGNAILAIPGDPPANDEADNDGASSAVRNLRQKRFVFLGDTESNAFPQYVVKNLNDTYSENHLKRLDENIYKFSKSVNFSDEKFSGGAQSGESRKWKLQSMENRAITKERKFERATLEMFKVLCSAWNIRNIPLGYEDITLAFTRNLPKDLGYEADVQGKLLGKVSDKTRLSLASFIPDPEKELEEMKKEAEEKGPALDDIPEEENPDGQGGKA